MSDAFDAVEWMRARRALIDSEDEGLGWREKNRRTLELLESDPLWQRFKSCLSSRPEAAARASPQDLRAK
jgi:hypothetical protein